DDSAVVNLPFAFPFYGQNKNQVRISSNGYLTFGSAGRTWSNAPIPSTADPNDLIALLWDDLDPTTAGTVYWYYDEPGDQFVVEYKGIAKWLGSESYTFQAILRPNGTIIYQYLSMVGDLTSATVGIENDTGTDGLQVAYNAPYVEDGLAIAFAPVGRILTVSPTSGYLLPGNHQDVVVTLGDGSDIAGEFSLYIYVSANDPFRPFAAIPVHLVINMPPAVTITAPADGAELHGVTEVKWTAADPDDAADELAIDLYWARDGETWNALGEGMENTGVFEWNTIEVGAGGDTFRLRAKVTDPTGASSEFTTGEFTIVNLAPSAAFSFTPSLATRRDVVKFTDESIDDGTITAWLWEFGDGATSDAQNPEHQYAEKGEFTIALTVTDNGGLTGTVGKSIVVGNAAPIAAFSFAPEAPNAGEAVTFANESIDDAEIIACVWEFGDGAMSVEHNPTHAYATSGVFTVRLTVIDDDHVANSVERSVEVVNAPPVAAFSFTPSSPSVRDVVKFTDETTDDGEIAAWHWEFGDGAASDEQNPEHQYNAKGKFTVKLTVTDDGDLSDSVEHEITVKNLPPEVRLLKPTAGAVWTGEQTIEWEATDPDDQASALKIALEYALQAAGSGWQVIATNQDNAGKHKWDTSQVAQGGRYKVRVTAIDPDGGTAGATSEEFIIVALARAIVAAPNPARDSVTFYYDIPADGTLYVYDIAGRLIYSALLPASTHAYEWNLHAGGRPLANGVYLYIVVGDAQKS
ncbi:MAG TPA: PKD domain-containing protein, partial [Rhodoglobus sp.]|nr:PKD domain-containing protein [Rhodoglobus sp.]